MQEMRTAYNIPHLQLRTSHAQVAMAVVLVGIHGWEIKSKMVAWPLVAYQMQIMKIRLFV
jgi:hypothetical protein